MLTLDHPELGKIVIGRPQATDDGQNFVVALRPPEGATQQIVGVTPLDALENAVKVARAFLPIRDDDPKGWQVS